MPHRLALPLLLLLLATPAAAQGVRRSRPMPQLVQELFVGETVQPQERGQWQVTLAARTDGRGAGEGRIEYGITDRFQIDLETPALDRDFAVVDDEDGRRTTPGVLVALLPDEWPLALSVRAGAGVARGLAPSWETGLVAARRWGRLQLHAGAELETTSGDRQASAALAALLAAGALTPTLTLAHDAEGDAGWRLVPGLFVHRGEWLEVGVGAPVSLARGGRAVDGARVVVTTEF